MERGDSALYRPLDEPVRIAAKRVADWEKAVGGDVPGAFDAWLTARELDRDALERRLGPVALIDSARLPRWGSTLTTALGLLPDVACSTPMVASFALLDPWLAAARHMASATLDPERVAASATDGMLAVLRARLWQALGGVLDYEVRAAQIGFGAGERGFDGSRDGWLDRLELFPAAAWLIGVSIDNWLTLIAEITARLAVDADAIAATFFDGHPPGQLIEFRGDAGDVHNHGRAVALLTFEGGARLVYKPKDLRTSAGFIALVEALNAAGLDPPLDAGRLLPRGGYAWECFVAPAACRDAAGVARFYRRMGALIRLFQMLEGRDLWLDNLIAAGDQPVFIDLETLLQPRLPSLGRTATERAGRALLAETVAELGTVTMPTPIEPGIACEELGALAPPRPYLSPFRQVPGSTGPATRDEFVTWQHPEHVPTLDGVAADSTAHLLAILAGYRAMQVILARAASLLRAPGGPLAALESAPVRYICRDTWSCQKLIQQSCAPAQLADPVLRERYLVQLHRALLSDDLDDAARHRHRAIVTSEIDSIRELDVPFFVSHPDSSGVWTVAGTMIAGHFDGTAWDRLQTRIAAIADFPLAEQEAVLLSAYGAAHRDVPAPHIARLLGDVGGPLVLAERIGRALLAAATQKGDDPALWLGLVYSPYIDGWTFEPVHDDLLSGSGALAILFADLHAACGGTGWRDAALLALRGTDRALARTPSYWSDLAASTTHRAVPPYVGAFVGTGAEMYVRRYCRARLGLRGERSLADTAIPLDALFRHASSDAVGGLAGLLLALASDPAQRSVRRPEIARLIEHLAAAPRDADGRIAQPLLPPGTMMLDGIPDASAAVDLALHRLGERARPGRFAVSSHIGNRLAALGCGQVGTVPATAAPLDAAEFALTAHALTGDPVHLSHARAAVDLLMRRHSATGTWFPATCRDDLHDLSPIRGIVAVARAMIGVTRPDLWASVRLQQCPEVLQGR